MKHDLTNMTALVTGGSSGIGLEYSRQLLARGCRVIIASNREQELAEAVRTLSSSDGGRISEPGSVTNQTSSPRVEGIHIDLAEEGSSEKLLQWCDDKDLHVDILVCNAGMFFMEYLSEENLGKARAMMKLHMQSVTELCVLFGSRMKARRKGFILIMSSMTARIPSPGIAIYSASKAYLKSFGKGFSYEMRPFGVIVTTVCPAAVDTGLYKLSAKTRRAGRRLGLIQTPEALVKRALNALFRGRRTVSPGIMNVLVPPLVRLLPNRVIDKLGLKLIY